MGNTLLWITYNKPIYIACPLSCILLGVLASVSNRCNGSFSLDASVCICFALVHMQPFAAETINFITLSQSTSLFGGATFQHLVKNLVSKVFLSTFSPLSLIRALMLSQNYAIIILCCRYLL